MKRIGVMGGTFDPIHFGHLLMAEQAYEQYELDSIMFLPTGEPPHKEGKKVTSSLDRLKMVQLAIEGNPHFFCSPMEIEQSGYSYTARTLKRLTENNPGIQYYFIVGADSLDYMENWYHPEEIFRYAVILAADRNTISKEQLIFKAEFLKERYGADIRMLPIPLVEYSSTKIRHKISEGKSIRYFVPESVSEYIASHRLYQR